MAQVPHPPCASGLPPDCFDAPIVLADASSRIAAGGAGALLEVEAPSAAPHAKRVSLVPPLTERARTFTHFSCGCLRER